jgi:hypothetical protein
MTKSGYVIDSRSQREATAKRTPGEVSNPRAKKTIARPATKFKVTHSKGRVIIDGVAEGKLVRQRSDGRFMLAPGTPKHLSTAQISKMMKSMRVK